MFDAAAYLILSKSTAWGRGRGLRSPERFLNLSPEIKFNSGAILCFCPDHLEKRTWNVQHPSLHGLGPCRGMQFHSLRSNQDLPSQGDRKPQVHGLLHRAPPDYPLGQD